MATQSGPAGGLRVGLERRLDRLLERPLIRKFDPWLGVSELRRLNPIIALAPMAITAILGARTSQFGHMDTVGGIFPVISLISALNPFVGLLSGLAFAGADFVQKFVVDDIFYEAAASGVDYWGARAGYLIAYSSMIMFGLVPGMLARIGGRIGEKVAARTATRGATVAEPSPNALRLGRAAGRAIGAALGGLGSAIAYQATAAPAFLLRASPDHSCYILSRGNVRAAIPGIMVLAAAGGGGSVVADGIGSDATVGDRSKDDDSSVCKELEGQYERLFTEWSQHYPKAEKGLKGLQVAQAKLAEMEQNRVALIEEQQGAVGYMLAAGGLAGAVVGSMFATFCARMASSWTRALDPYRLLVPLEADADAWLAANAWKLANQGQPALWAGRAARAVKTGVGTGLGAGAAAGKLLEQQMERGLAQFNEMARVQERLVAEFRDTLLVMVHDENRMQRELATLGGRIKQECGREMQAPHAQPLPAPRRD